MKKPEREEIPIRLIDFDDHQFRFRRNFPIEDVIKMSESVKQTSQLNPVKVRKKVDGRYQLLAGWKRGYAVRWLGDRPLICDVYDGISDEEAYRINITDNEQRENLTPIELAHQVTHLKDKVGYDVEQIAGMFGCKKSRIYDLLQLSQMPERVKDAVDRGDLTVYQAFEIEKAPVSERSEIFQKAVDEGWSVRRIRQERQGYEHPLYNVKLPLYFTRKNKWHAVRFGMTSDIERLHIRCWEIFERHYGVPAPLKCKFTMSIPASKSNPPFVCMNEIEWVVLSSGDLLEDDRSSRNEEYNMPLEERDGWFFFCERCTKLLFPNCEFHPDRFFWPRFLYEHA